MTLQSTLQSTLRATGASITATIPKAVADALGLKPGQTIHWMPDGAGSFRIVPVEPEQTGMLEHARRIMDHYAPVFARLGREEH